MVSSAFNSKISNLGENRDILAVTGFPQHVACEKTLLSCGKRHFQQLTGKNSAFCAVESGQIFKIEFLGHKKSIFHM
jgi:hypothetical protein